nr:MAG: hypothetical protein [Sanya tombus-like virus 8]
MTSVGFPVVVPPFSFATTLWDFLVGCFFTALFFAMLGISLVAYYWPLVVYYPLYGSIYLYIWFTEVWINNNGPIWWCFVGAWVPVLHIKLVLLWVRSCVGLLKWGWPVVANLTAPGWLVEVCIAWILRGTKAPPAVQPAEVVHDPTLSGHVLAHMRGSFYAQAAQVKHASLAAGGITVSRIRRRSRWVGALQDYLGGRPGIVGELVRGRWTPDLPSDRRALSANAFLSTFDGESKLLGGGVLPSDDPDVHEPFLIVQTRSGREVVVPSLLGRLSRYSCFRDRDDALLAGLRSRAQEWCADKKVVDCVLPLIIPSACAMAYLVSAPERLAMESLQASGHFTNQSL